MALHWKATDRTKSSTFPWKGGEENSPLRCSKHSRLWSKYKFSKEWMHFLNRKAWLMPGRIPATRKKGWTGRGPENLGKQGMVSPHSAQPCWKHSMPRSHCSHQRGTSESHSDLTWADFPSGFAITLHQWQKRSGRAAALPMESVSLQHLILRCDKSEPVLWAIFFLCLISSWWLTSESGRVLNYSYSPLNLGNIGLCNEQRHYM